MGLLNQIKLRSEAGSRRSNVIQGKTDQVGQLYREVE
jgi:hypothetical protein